MLKDSPLFTECQELEEKERVAFHKSKAAGEKGGKLAFKEILCPKTAQALCSEDCHTCPHKRELRRVHSIGLSLVAIICMWNVKESPQRQ